MHGAILEMSPRLASRAHAMELVIPPGGRVADRAGGGWTLMPTIHVVRRPQPRLPEVTPAPTRKRTPRKRSTTS